MRQTRISTPFLSRFRCHLAGSCARTPRGRAWQVPQWASSGLRWSQRRSASPSCRMRREERSPVSVRPCRFPFCWVLTLPSAHSGVVFPLCLGAPQNAGFHLAFPFNHPKKGTLKTIPTRLGRLSLGARDLLRGSMGTLISRGGVQGC